MDDVAYSISSEEFKCVYRLQLWVNGIGDFEALCGLWYEFDLVHMPMKLLDSFTCMTYSLALLAFQGHPEPSQ